MLAYGHNDVDTYFLSAYCMHMTYIVERVWHTENGAFYHVTNLLDVCCLHSDTTTTMMMKMTMVAHKFPEHNI